MPHVAFKVYGSGLPGACEYVSCRIIFTVNGDCLTKEVKLALYHLVLLVSGSILLMTGSPCCAIWPSHSVAVASP